MPESSRRISSPVRSPRPLLTGPSSPSRFTVAAAESFDPRAEIQDLDAEFLLGLTPNRGQRVLGRMRSQRDDGHAERAALPEVLVIDLREGEMKPAFQAPLEAVQDGALLLERLAVGNEKLQPGHAVVHADRLRVS